MLPSKDFLVLFAQEKNPKLFTDFGLKVKIKAKSMNFLNFIGTP